MTKKWLVASIIILFTVSATGAFGQLLEQFDRTVDFSVTMRELTDAVDSGNLASLVDRVLIIDGTVASRDVYDSSPDTYLGLLELIGGEWMGVEDVVMYRCYVFLQGPQFVNAIPARRSRTKHPDEIDLNTRVLIAAELVDIQEIAPGEVVPILLAYYVRKID